MIAHRGFIRERLTVLFSLERIDIAKLFSGSVVVWKKYADADLTQYGPDVIIKYVESPQEANRYANELLSNGEKI